MLRLRFLFLDNNNKKPMSLPVKAFVISQGKKSGSMRGPRTSAPPTPKVKPPKRAKFLEDCVHLVSCDIYKERKFIILNTVRTELTGFIDESTLMCVSISRQKVFLVVIGNASFLSAHTSYWKSFIEFLHKDGHVVKPSDFKFVR